MKLCALAELKAVRKAMATHGGNELGVLDDHRRGPIHVDLERQLIELGERPPSVQLLHRAHVRVPDEQDGKKC